MTQTASPQRAPLETTVIYNETCPICSREVDMYARYAKSKALPLRFEGLATADLAAWDLTPEAAARRFHVVKDGQLYAGVPAFVNLWDEMPRFRWLAYLLRLPGVSSLAAVVYDRMLAPRLYRLHEKRQARRAALAKSP